MTREGSGKTFASIRFALNNIKDNGQIFYIAPFKTILEQNAAEVRNVLGENSVFEHHSDIVQRNEAYDLYAEGYNFPIIFTISLLHHRKQCFKTIKGKDIATT